MENIIGKIRSYYPISDEGIRLLISHLKREVIPAKATILQNLFFATLNRPF